MKTVVKYESKDGVLFSSEGVCLEYEAFYEQVCDVLSLLNNVPDDLEFTNGGGYVQQNASFVREAGVRAKAITSTKKLWTEADSILFQKMWHRLESIDAQFREWGQPYFAKHPDQAPYQGRIRPAA